MKDAFLATLYNDRVESLEHVSIGWVKKNGIDLLIKQMIFMINSFGKKSSCIDYLFVDEIKNNNMQNNLRKTKSVFESHKEKIATVTFNHLERTGHVKLGYLLPACDICLTGIKIMATSLLGLFGKPQLKSVIKYLYTRVSKLMPATRDIKEIYLMSDHHFFSSIIAFEETEKCAILQHGLVMDKRFYYPIRAGKFCAWGERSRQLQNNDAKVVVTGTYKFDGMSSKANCDTIKQIMFLIGSLDNEKVKEKIDTLVKICEEKQFNLIIKCHPGSLFDKTIWEKSYHDKGVAFYKEELIQDLDFDLAVSENSTAIMDLIALNKPFVLFDEIEEYFSVYRSVLPHGNSDREIEEILLHITDFDFRAIMDEIRNKELNSGECYIYELRKQ